MEREVNLDFPFGEADVQELAYAVTQAVEVKNAKTILKFATLTGDTTLNLTITLQLKVGSTLLVKVPATANADDLTFGTGIDAPAIVGVAGKTKTQGFEYDGQTFVPVGAVVQID